MAIPVEFPPCECCDECPECICHEECTCLQTDVDLFDARDCEQHNRNEPTMRLVMTDEPCPF